MDVSDETMCAAGDGPITLANGESMSASSGPDGEVLFWHRHCYDLAHVPPAREVTPEAGQRIMAEPIDTAFPEWLTKWLDEAFKRTPDDEFAAKLVADMDAANWKVFKVTFVPFTGFFKIGEETEHG